MVRILRLWTGMSQVLKPGRSPGTSSFVFHSTELISEFWTFPKCPFVSHVRVWTHRGGGGGGNEGMINIKYHH